MSTNTHVSLAGWNAALNAITALANGGTVGIYTGSQPLTSGVTYGVSSWSLSCPSGQ